MQHLWTTADADKGESPTAGRSGGKRRGPGPLKREAEVIDLTTDEAPSQGRSSEPRPPPVKKVPTAAGTSNEARQPAPSTVGSAWLNAAMAWRQKNMPSASELKRRKADAARRAAKESAARKSRAKEFRFRANIAVERERQRLDFDPLSPKHSFAADPSIVRPADTASAEQWQTFFRAYHGSRIRNAASFVQVLRAFGIPCDDPKKIKVAYMQAVRMYHPDSNSKTRTFRTPRDRLEAEEIIKLINQRKPEQF
jgi:hypothetical protein